MGTMSAVDTNVTVHEKQTAEWVKYEYDIFAAYLKDHVPAALEWLKLPYRGTARCSKPLREWNCGGISSVPLRQNVFVKNIEVTLTKKSLLYYST
ncbi:MAG: hypothetical protein LBQ15_08675 [Clostridium sp.]|jgi:hypothetical protein|nr:hypothetical protein [Clostridium sp.]